MITRTQGRQGLGGEGRGQSCKLQFGDPRPREEPGG